MKANECAQDVDPDESDAEAENLFFFKKRRDRSSSRERQVLKRSRVHIEELTSGSEEVVKKDKRKAKAKAKSKGKSQTNAEDKSLKSMKTKEEKQENKEAHVEKVDKKDKGTKIGKLNHEEQVCRVWFLCLYYWILLCFHFNLMINEHESIAHRIGPGEGKAHQGWWKLHGDQDVAKELGRWTKTIWKMDQELQEIGRVFRYIRRGQSRARTRQRTITKKNWSQRVGYRVEQATLRKYASRTHFCILLYWAGVQIHVSFIQIMCITTLKMRVNDVMRVQETRSPDKIVIHWLASSITTCILLLPMLQTTWSRTRNCSSTSSRQHTRVFEFCVLITLFCMCGSGSAW